MPPGVGVPSTHLPKMARATSPHDKTKGAVISHRPLDFCVERVQRAPTLSTSASQSCVA